MTEAIDAKRTHGLLTKNPKPTVEDKDLEPLSTYLLAC